MRVRYTGLARWALSGPPSALEALEEMSSVKVPVAHKALSIFLGLGVSLTALALYIGTLAPTVLYYDPRGIYDSVTFQVYSYILDIPHPTGYPTFTMLAHLFTYLPFGDVAYRVNLASAVFGASAVLLIFAACLAITGRRWASAGATLLFAVSEAFWSQAVIAEVYTLNVLMVMLVLVTLLYWQRRRTDRLLLLAVFLIGFAMTNHMTSGLLLPAAMIFVFLVDKSRLREWRLILKGIGLFILGLTPYLYLPIRASMNPPVNEMDPSTLGNFIALVTGQKFENRMFVYSPLELPGRLMSYFGHLVDQFNPAFLVVALFGAFYLSRKNRALFAMLSFLYLGWLFYALEYNIIDVYLYYIPTYLIICLFVAVGFGAALDLTASSMDHASDAKRVSVLGILAILMLLAPIPGIEATATTVDRSEDYRGREIVESVASGVAKGSTILHNGSSVWYLPLVEGRRTDLTVRDPFPAGDWTTRSPRWLKVAQRHLDDGRVYIIFPGTSAANNATIFNKAGYDLIPDKKGVFYEVVRRERSRD